METVKLPKMQDREVEELINEQFLCRVAFKGTIYPYIAPFQYAVVNGTIYLHFTEYGKKMNFLEQGTPVSVEIERYTPNLSEYAFVVLTGRLKLVKNSEEKKVAVQKMAEVGKKRLSPNFLVAHGFSKGSEWLNFSENQEILIIKLEVTENMGLKSP
jgi:nitroimidazol reductase NimA-like FMN-containing flavoprotein (pyridoxamine 5'-phosphate oxidase superfamily)